MDENNELKEEKNNEVTNNEILDNVQGEAVVSEPITEQVTTDVLGSTLKEKEEPTVFDTNNNNKKSSKKCIIILIIVVLIALGGLVYYLLNNNDDGDNKTTGDKRQTEEKKKDDKKTIVSKSEIKKADYFMSGNELENFDLYFMKIEDDSKNLVYSPISIKYALEMLSDGANGETKEQIDSVIGKYAARQYKNSSNLSFANALFINSDIKDSINNSYINKLKGTYNAEVINDDFKSPDNINAWIKDKTLNLIDNMLDSIDSDIMFTLVNALAIDMEWKNVIQPIEGGWGVRYDHEDYYTGVSGLKGSGYKELEFDDDQKAKSVVIGASINNYDIISDLGEENIRKTVSAEYQKFLDNGACHNDLEFPDVDTYMNSYIDEISKNYKNASSSTDFMLYNDENVKAFAKDLKEYDGVTLQYIGIMPTKEDLKSFIANKDASDINKIINNLKEIKNGNFKNGVITTVTGQIPLFKFEYSLDLISDLNKLGIINVFDFEKSDLSNITSNDKAYIDSALHKANIEFSNEGIKAAAVTTMSGYGAGGCGFDYRYEVPVEEIDLTFDKPYIFIIRDKVTGEVWFMGSVYEPTKHEISKDGIVR